MYISPYYIGEMSLKCHLNVSFYFDWRKLLMTSDLETSHPKSLITILHQYKAFNDVKGFGVTTLHSDNVP